jgi:DNA-binding LacI/PurR family transcriptional regulator
MPVKRASPPLRSVTVTDIARAADVSKSTVSVVLQGSPPIKPDTAARVRERAAALGYVYNRGAADLRRKSSNMIGMVINALTNPFFAELLVGMERKLVDAGYISLMAHTDEELVAGPEIGVVGFDGAAATEHSNPLSTVGVEPSHLGEIAAEILLKRLREPDAVPLKHLAMPPLIVRHRRSTRLTCNRMSSSLGIPWKGQGRSRACGGAVVTLYKPAVLIREMNHGKL